MVPQLSVTLPNFGALFPLGEWRRYLDLARLAEDEGMQRIVVVDHVVMGRNTGAYPVGTFPGTTDEPWLEPLTILAAVAAVTERVRLATGILIAPLRGAAVLAKTAATLDQLSGGRLDLGVGTGWQREEYDAAGLPGRDIGPRLLPRPRGRLCRRHVLTPLDAKERHVRRDPRRPRPGPGPYAHLPAPRGRERVQ